MAEDGGRREEHGKAPGSTVRHAVQQVKRADAFPPPEPTHDCVSAGCSQGCSRGQPGLDRYRVPLTRVPARAGRARDHDQTARERQATSRRAATIGGHAPEPFYSTPSIGMTSNEVALQTKRG